MAPFFYERNKSDSGLNEYYFLADGFWEMNGKCRSACVNQMSVANCLT